SLEKELQKDPFAAEAAEGLSEIPADQAAKDIHTIRKKIERRVSGRKTIIWYRIAASVAVLMIISSLFVVIEKKKSSRHLNEEIALSTQSKTVESKLIPAPQANEIKEAAKQENPPTPSPSNKKKLNINVSYKNLLLKHEVQAPVANIANKYNEITGTDTIKKLLSVSSDTTANILSEQAMAEKKEDMADKATELAYKPSEPTKNEAAVSGYAVSKSSRAASVASAEKAATAYTPPEPSGGKDNFDKYILKNLRNPETSKTGTSKEVELKLTILKTGVIDKIKIIKSPGKEFSSEAIRLIKEGPEWIPASKNGVPVDDEVLTRIVFK
ncbi:MAG: energy transducer TonB, partial [Bacteroidales bacterium]